MAVGCGSTDFTSTGGGAEICAASGIEVDGAGSAGRAAIFCGSTFAGSGGAITAAGAASFSCAGSTNAERRVSCGTAAALGVAGAVTAGKAGSTAATAVGAVLTSARGKLTKATVSELKGWTRAAIVGAETRITAAVAATAAAKIPILARRHCRVACAHRIANRLVRRIGADKRNTRDMTSPLRSYETIWKTRWQFPRSWRSLGTRLTETYGVHQTEIAWSIKLIADLDILAT
jgi:hypothetical protein